MEAPPPPALLTRVPEVLAAQGLQAFRQGTVQTGLSSLPGGLEEGREKPPQQAHQVGVPDDLRHDDTWVYHIGGDPRP